MGKLPVDEATKCSECEHLMRDSKVNRCELYDKAVIDDISEKHCKDSIR